MNFEKEVRKVLLDTIELFQFGYESIIIDMEHNVSREYELPSEDIKKFVENKKDVIEYGTKKIMELVKKAGVK